MSGEGTAPTFRAHSFLSCSWKYENWQGHGWKNLFKVHQGYLRVQFFLIKNHKMKYRTWGIRHKRLLLSLSLLILKITSYKQQPWTAALGASLNWKILPFKSGLLSGEHVPNQLTFLYHSNFKPAAISCIRVIVRSLLLLQSLEQVKLLWPAPGFLQQDNKWIPQSHLDSLQTLVWHLASRWWHRKVQWWHRKTEGKKNVQWRAGGSRESRENQN